MALLMSRLGALCASLCLAFCFLGVSGLNGLGALDSARNAEKDASVSLSQLQQVEHAFWAGKNGDALRTGKTGVIVPTNLTKGSTWSWKAPDNGLVRATPIIDEHSNIYLATINGEVRKLTPLGKLIWSHQENSSIPSVPALVGNRLFLGCENGDTVALDTETGSVIWRTPSTFVGLDNKASGLDTWSMAAAEGVVLGARIDPSLWSWGGGNNHIVAFNAETGAQMWDFVVPQLVYNILCDIVEGTVVFSDQRGTPHRLNLTTGEVIWKGKQHERAGWTTGAAIVGPNRVVYVTSNLLKGNVVDPGEPNLMGLTLTLFQIGILSAYDLDTGKLLFQTQLLDLPANSGPAVGHLSRDKSNKLSVVMGSGPNPEPPNIIMQAIPKPSRVVAVDALSGEIEWSFDLPMWHGKSAGDGLLPLRICMPDSFSNPAIAGDGTVFIGSMTGRVYAIQDRDGDGVISEAKGEATFFDTKNGFQGSPALAPGLLAVTPCDSIHVFLGEGHY